MVASAQATTLGYLQLLTHRLEILRERRATNVYEHLDKEGCKAIKRKMKDAYGSSSTHAKL